VWAEFLTDDPAAWKVRIGEHNMFREDTTQLDMNVERILFHPARDRQSLSKFCTHIVCITYSLSKKPDLYEIPE